MLEQLFVNACILVTIIFITSQLFRNSYVSPSSSIITKISFGLTGAISASILMYFGIDVTPHSFLDFRHIIEILVALYGGLIPSIITGVLGAFYRLVYNGIDHSSIISAVGVVVVSVACGLISITHLSRIIKLLAMLSFSLAARSMIFYILIENKQSMLTSIFSLFISSIIVAPAAYYLVQYLITAQNVLNRLKQESSHDFLTGLKNPRHFDQILNGVVQHSVEEKRKVSMLMIDIDHFKRINDSYGHISGDYVLKELSLVFQKTFRKVDEVSRIGGEEFIVILKDISLEITNEIAERLRSNVESHMFILPDGKKISITASIGAAVFPDTVDCIEDLKKVADQKMYEAKKTGRNKVCI